MAWRIYTIWVYTLLQVRIGHLSRGKLALWQEKWSVSRWRYPKTHGRAFPQSVPFSWTWLWSWWCLTGRSVCELWLCEDTPGLSLAWREGAAVGGLLYLERFKSILPDLCFVRYLLNTHITSSVSPHTHLFSYHGHHYSGRVPHSLITPAKRCRRAGLGAARLTSQGMGPPDRAFLFLPRFLNTRSSNLTDKKMACRSVERPTFFEIFKTRCSDSGTA